MTSSNLGIVFGPTLMRPRPTDATISLSSLVDYPHQARIVEALIIFYSTIFENKESAVLGDSSKYSTESKEEAAGCSDLVGACGTGSTPRGRRPTETPCLCSKPGADQPGQPLLRPQHPQLPPERCPASGSALHRGCSPSLPCPTMVRVWPTLLPFSLDPLPVPPCIPTPLVSDFLPQKNSFCR